MTTWEEKCSVYKMQVIDQKTASVRQKQYKSPTKNSKSSAKKKKKSSSKKMQAIILKYTSHWPKKMQVIDPRNSSYQPKKKSNS